MLPKKNILGIQITDATKENILEYILDSLQNSYKPYYIVTPNPEMLVRAEKEISFRNILNKAELALADGVGLIFAGKILSKPLKTRVTGTDLLENLRYRIENQNRESAKKPITVGFLGGKGNVAERTAKCLLKRYPDLAVVFAKNEWPETEKIEDRKLKVGVEDRSLKIDDEELYPPSSNIKDQSSMSYHLSSNSIDILFVAFGAPKQEIWMAEHVGKIPVKVMMGVGGAFDYISGDVLRAPFFIRALGFEWLFRLILQPWRIKRQIALLQFALLVLKEKFH